MGEAMPVLGGMGKAVAIGEESNAVVKSLSRDAELARENAKTARAAGKFNANRQQEEAEQIFGAMKADVSASGTEQSSGNVLDLLRQSHQRAELDRLVILHEADMRAKGLLNQASGYEADIQSTLKSADRMKAAALITGAGGSISRMPATSPATNNEPTPRYRSAGAGGTGYETYGGSGYMRS